MDRRYPFRESHPPNLHDVNLPRVDKVFRGDNWARLLQELGHEVWLLLAKAVQPFVVGNKNDGHQAYSQNTPEIISLRINTD